MNPQDIEDDIRNFETLGLETHGTHVMGVPTRQKSLSVVLDEIDWLSDEEAALAVQPALVKALRRAVNGIEATLRDNLHLADGENCTLIALKQTLSDVTQLLTSPPEKTSK